MSQVTPTDGQYALLVQRIEFLQKEIDSNKRDADADIRGVREKAESDNKNSLAQIAALEAERKKALIWGVTTLGTAVLVMGSWILSKLFTGSIKW